jgi:putative NADH-flavin reductase
VKLVIFGATGGTGRHVIEQALVAGHTVTAVARRPDTITFGHERLTVVRGDVFEPETLLNPMTRQEVVISAIGIARIQPTTLYSVGTASIMRAMQSAGVRRLICISSSAVEVGPGTPFMDRLFITQVLQRLLRDVYADFIRMEVEVRNSGLDWTIIRAPRLTNGPIRGKYQIGITRHLPAARGFSRADVADYIVKHLDDKTTYCKTVELAYE